MAGELEQSAAGAIDKLVQSADALTAKLGALAEKYGPEVIDAGLTVVQIEGASNVLVGLIGAAVAGLASVYAPRFFRRGQEQWQAYLKNRVGPEGDACMAAGFGNAVVGGIGALVALLTLANLWNWVAIFSPKLWIAHKLLNL